MAARVDRGVDDDDGVDERRQPPLVDARRVRRVDVARGVDAVRLGVARRRDRVREAARRLGQVGDLGRRAGVRLGCQKAGGGEEGQTLHDDLRAASGPQNESTSQPSGAIGRMRPA
jgi:hypothetical protein